ncbi:transcriptional regulator [Moraxella sp. RCAD0137]
MTINLTNLHHENKSMQLRITQKIACEILCVSYKGLQLLREQDDSFPKPYKSGTSRQAAVYYDYNEIVQWHKNQLKKQNEESNNDVAQTTQSTN